MGSYFSTYEPATSSGGWDTDSHGSTNLPDLPDSFQGGGMSGPPGVAGGPGAFKRRFVRQAGLRGRGQDLEKKISGGKGDMQSSSSVDQQLARMIATGQQRYLDRDGGAVQGDNAGQVANHTAMQAEGNEGGREAAERGTYPFSGENPHTRDAAQDNSLALSRGAARGTVFPGVNGGYDTMTPAGWDVDDVTSFPYRPGDERRGKFQPDPAAAEYHTDLAWTPAQKLAARLAADFDTKPQAYPAMPKLGDGIIAQTNNGYGTLRN